MTRRAAGDVESLLAAVPVERVMALVDALSRLDRYQASAGVQRAADLLAHAAEAAGLADVGVRRHAAQPAPPFWTFERPAPWTPRTATLAVVDRHGATLLQLDHATAPFALATNAAPTPERGLRAPMVPAAARDRWPGAIVAFDRATTTGVPLEALLAAGAAGFVSDHAAVRDADGRPVTGRIEMPAGCGLLAFSLTPPQMDAVLAATEPEAHALVAVDATASMPVVSACLPGAADGPELWVVGHLCHPRPSANDNASGAAALIGLATLLVAQQQPRRTVRFVWAPEFVGTAAALHEAVERDGPAGAPATLLNLDMVGEDQDLCRTPLVVERGPRAQAAAVAAGAADAVFAATARPGHAWRPAPFEGASDHAVLADPRIGCEVVHLCHKRDPFNHSAADTIDKVSPLELRRSIAIAAVAAQAACTDDARGGTPVGGEPPCGGSPGALHVVWPGPLNLRAVLQRLGDATRRAVDAQLAREPGCRALLVNLAYLADGTRDRTALLAAATAAVDEPVPPAAGAPLLDALLEAGAVATEPAGQPWWAAAPPPRGSSQDDGLLDAVPDAEDRDVRPADADVEVQ